MFGREKMLTTMAVLAALLFCPALAAAQASASGAKPAKAPTPLPEPSKAKKPPKLQIAFFQLEVQGVEQKVSTIVSDSILIEMTKLPDTTVIGSKEIDAMLGFEQKKQMSGCTDTSCMVAIGGALGVDKILMGNVGKLGASYMLNLKLLDIKKGTIEAMFNKRLKGGTEEDFLDLVPEALAAVFPASAAVWAKTDQRPTTHDKRPEDDGSRRGADGGGAVGEARSAERKSSRATSAATTSDKPVMIKEARKAPPPPPGGPSVWPWVLMGTGAAVVVGGGVTHYLAFGDFDSFKDTPETDPKREDLKSSAGLKQTLAFVLYGAGAAAAAGGLIWYYLEGDAPAKTGAIQIGPMIGTPGFVLEGGW
ncbi:MAG: hypothetical protein HY897_19160 [Deltaproteobacteria bacterium]|nr:hypothetical protein [Deltaproteobacteria bacterium]